MFKSLSKHVSVLNRICVFFMLALLLLQFMPFWQYGDPAAEVSIQGYIWLPNEHTGLDALFQKTLDADYTINQVLAMPILVLVLGAAGTVCCLVYSNKPLVSLLPLSCGLAGLVGYLAQPAFRLGANWSIHLIVCAVLIVLGALSLLAGLTGDRS